MHGRCDHRAAAPGGAGAPVWPALGVPVIVGPTAHREDRGGPRAGGAPADRGDLRRLAPGLSPARHRHREAHAPGARAGCRITASTWSSRASATAPAASPAKRRDGSTRSGAADGCRSSWAAPASTSARSPKGCSSSRRSIRPGAARWTRWTARLEPLELVRWAGAARSRLRGGGRQRAARAIEIALLTGRALSDWHGRRQGGSRHRPWYVRPHRAAAGPAAADRAAGRGDGPAGADRGGGRGAGAKGTQPTRPDSTAIGIREAVEYLHGQRPRERLPKRSRSAPGSTPSGRRPGFGTSCGGDAGCVTLDASRPPDRRGRGNRGSLDVVTADRVRALIVPTDHRHSERSRMKIGITCYPTYGGSGAVATELGLELARRGHEVHFITYAIAVPPPGIRRGVYFHEVETRMGRYPLFDHFPYTLALASKQHEVALREGLESSTSTTPSPTPPPRSSPGRCCQPEHPIKVITTLHGTDITLVGQESSFYAITKFSIERSDAVTAVSAYLRDETYRAFGCVTCDLQVIPNFVNLEEYRPGADGSAKLARAGGPQDHHPHLQLPGGEAGEGRDPGLRPDPPGHAGHPADDRRRPRAGGRGERGPRAAGGGRRALPRAARLGGVAPPGQRSLPPALADRVVRPRGAGSDGLRRPRSWPLAPAACPRWWTTA